MDRIYRDYTQPWKSIVAVVMVVMGAACFILSSICAMIVAGNKKTH